MEWTNPPSTMAEVEAARRGKPLWKGTSRLDEKLAAKKDDQGGLERQKKEERPFGLPWRELFTPCRGCGVATRIGFPSGFRMYCSRSCKAAHQAERTIKPRATCPICGKPAPNPKQKCCSAKCAYRMRKLRTRQPRTCPVCKREYFHKGDIRLKYCSIRCYNTVRSSTSHEEFRCAQCLKAVRRRKLRTRPRKHQFCSRECSLAFHVGEKSAMWRGGSDPNRGAKWIRLAESIRERDARRCRRCGRTEAENGRKLDVDHIRPWRSFRTEEEANASSNLVSLCSKCHRWKTGTVERAWLKGDRIGLLEYERSVAMTANA